MIVTIKVHEGKTSEEKKTSSLGGDLTIQLDKVNHLVKRPALRELAHLNPHKGIDKISSPLLRYSTFSSQNPHPLVQYLTDGRYAASYVNSLF